MYGKGKRLKSEGYCILAFTVIMVTRGTEMVVGQLKGNRLQFEAYCTLALPTIGCIRIRAAILGAWCNGIQWRSLLEVMQDKRRGSFKHTRFVALSILRLKYV